MAKLVRKERLICVLAQEDGKAKNNNKFYDMELFDDGTVVCTYGRVGGGTPAVQTYTGGEAEFNKIYRKKTERKKEPYKPLRTIDASLGETVKVSRGNLMDLAISQIRTKPPTAPEPCKEAVSVLKDIVSGNIHNITGATNITYDEKDGIFKTPLGVVTADAVDEAKLLLDTLDDLIKQRALESKILDMNAQYMAIIPTKADFRKRQNLIFAHADVEAQRNICDNLLDSLKVIQSASTNGNGGTVKVEHPKVFGAELFFEPDPATAKKVIDYFDRSKNRMHGGKGNGARVKRVFRMGLDIEQERFQRKKAELGEVHFLWHGTRLGNILSIMRNGLMMPNMSPGQKAGAMFGHGIYFANQSTKSLNYCDGMYWASGSRSTPKVYMFQAEVAVGKYFVPRSSGGHSRPPAGYHSFWAKANQSGVMNDEIVVFDLAQIRLSHLLEIELGSGY